LGFATRTKNYLEKTESINITSMIRLSHLWLHVINPFAPDFSD
jgi:hypothetical protein